MSTDDRWGSDDPRDDRRRRGPDPAAGRAKAKPPGYGLIAAGVLSLLGIGVGVFQYSTLPAQFEAERAKMDANPQFDAAARKQAKEILDAYEKGVMAVIPVTWVLTGVASLVVIVGGVKLMNTSGRGWARAGAILALIPCVSGCCIVGMPVGLWALLVLGDPNVKAAFDAARRDDSDEPRDEWDDRQR